MISKKIFNNRAVCFFFASVCLFVSFSAAGMSETGQEDRQALQQELKVMIEERRGMVDRGAKPAEIEEITQRIQGKSRSLASRPPLVSNMSADAQKVFDQEFLAHKAKLDELGKAYKDLIDKKAPKEELDVVIKQINDERMNMQRFLQTSMPPLQPNPNQPAPPHSDHDGHQH